MFLYIKKILSSIKKLMYTCNQINRELCVLKNKKNSH